MFKFHESGLSDAIQTSTHSTLTAQNLNFQAISTFIDYCKLTAFNESSERSKW